VELEPLVEPALEPKDCHTVIARRRECQAVKASRLEAMRAYADAQ